MRYISSGIIINVDPKLNIVEYCFDISSEMTDSYLTY